MARRLALSLLAVVGEVACSGGAQVGRVGGSIALLTNGQLAVVNPDQGSVSFVDESSLATLSTVSVGGDPHALLQTQDGSLWVATHRGGSLVRIDLSSGVSSGTASAQVATTLTPCPSPTGLAESPDGKFIAVTCEWSGEVWRVDPSSGAATPIAAGLVRPRAVAVVGQSVLVAPTLSGQVWTLASSGSSALSLVPTAAPSRPELTLMTANVATAIAAGFGHLFVAHELVNHTGDSTFEATAEDYGTVPNDNPKINAAVTRLDLSGETLSAPADTPPTYSRFDVPAHTLTGPSALAPFGSRFLLVAHLSTNDVAVLDTTATDPAQRLVATYEVGAGPSGIAVDEQKQLAFVDNQIDGSVSAIDLTRQTAAAAPDYPAIQTVARLLPSPYSDAAQQGRRLFYDATNPHVTPARVVACATCHPDGQDDGLVWFMHTPAIPLKRRRTPHLANASTATAPFHWDGSFATMADLTNSTITDLMAGDDLLVDATTVQAFVDEMVQPRTPPAQDPAAVARGQAVFNGAGECLTCHTGPNFTDGQEHAVLSPMSLNADDVFTAANTPDLHGLFDRAPFFHDGRATSLLDLLTRPDAQLHGNVGVLSQSEISDLVVYLQSL